MASVLYGVASVLVLFLWARRLFSDPRTAMLAAGLFALGGLHVTQSHFFLADVPALFWLLLGLYLLHADLDQSDKAKLLPLSGAAFAFGAAFGIKLVIAGLIPLVLIAIWSRPRWIRAAQIAAFFIAGLIVINMGFFTPMDLFRVVTRGINDPWQFSRLNSAILYLAELPSIVSLPVTLLGVAGAAWLACRLFAPSSRKRLVPALLLTVVPLLVNLWVTVFKTDHFPRHLIPFIPWVCLAAAWALTRCADWLAAKGIPRAVPVTIVFVYLGLFVYDGERVFLNEPRNDAARWLARNLAPGTALWWRGHSLHAFPNVNFPEKGRPQVIAIEMHSANHYLSDLGWKNTFPRDYRRIFGAGGSQEKVDQLQSLFQGKSEYRETVRFPEGYFMPEYVITDRLIGNRSRNYVAEITIFFKGSGEL
ncbi:MAG: phospholipid carrier-dependent glycosyltransferase [Bryobacteraceae bacterium]|nr:phospholipid carrier-dependent glycosyltransferase [Bryobacteraceae bacterium]